MSKQEIPPVCGMVAPGTPRNEAERLAALRNLDLLDTSPSETFDRVTRMAAELLRVPIVLVSLVDERRQWFKSKVGLAASETPRDVSFCGHVVYENKPLAVPDAMLDERFAGNPLVTGEPRVRAYLGIPLVSQKGFPLGTLCAIDTRPHQFDEDDQRKLDDCVKILEQLLHAKELEKSTNEVLKFAHERERLFRDTFDLAAVGITHTALSGKLLRVNRRTCEMLGYTEEELREISFIDITHPDDIARNIVLFEQMMSGKLDSYRLEKRFLRKDGEYLWTGISVALKRTERGEPDYMIAVMEDIAARKQAELDLIEARDSLQSKVAEQTAKLRESNEALQTHVKKVLESEREVRQTARRFRAIADNIPALVGYWNRDMVCVFANEVHREWFGLDPLKIAGMSMQQLLGAAAFERVEPHLQVALEGHVQRFEIGSEQADGSQRYTDVRYIPDRLSSGAVAGVYVLATDVTQSRSAQKALEAANAKLTTDSVTDFLTNLSNRRVFCERSVEALKRYHKHRETYGLILLDLDNFKQINDVHGHAIGDEVLKVIGTLLKGQLRSHRDIAARLGGEEFAVLCFGDVDETILCTIAERLRITVSQQSVRSGSKLLRFTSSFGCALVHESDTDWKNIYTRADAALYEAKAKGKDQVAFSDNMSIGQTGKFRALRVGTG